MKVPGSNASTNVFNRGDSDGLAIGAAALVDGLAAGIDAGQIGGERYGFSPGEEVLGLLGKKSATLLLIKKENGSRWKALALGGGHYGCGILTTERGGRFALF